MTSVMNAAVGKSSPWPEPGQNAVLSGLKVVDLTTALSGPFVTLTLAGLGAEVIKVEPPGGRDNARGNPPFLGPGGLHFGTPDEGDVSITVLNRHRNKKSVTIDLKRPEGLHLLRGLVEWADVLVENYSDGVTRRLGVDYESVRSWNPGLVYCSITGFGDGSPYAHLKTMDILVQAMSGIMEVTGFAEGPPTRVGVPVADMVAPLYGTIGLLAALWNRARTGQGQRIEVSMIDALSALVAEEHFDVLHRAGMPYRSGNHLPRLAPFGVYPTTDGYVAITGAVDSWTVLLFEAMGRPELGTDPRFTTRGARAANARELNDVITGWTITRTMDEVIEELSDKRGVPAAPVRAPAEVVQDPFLRGRGSIVELRHPNADGVPETVMGCGIPIQFSGRGRAGVGRAAWVGEHTDEVLSAVLGLSGEQIAALHEDGIL